MSYRSGENEDLVIRLGLLGAKSTDRKLSVESIESDLTWQTRHRGQDDVVVGHAHSRHLEYIRSLEVKRDRAVEDPSASDSTVAVGYDNEIFRTDQGSG